MQPLIWDRRPDGLRAPAMVCAFEGWNDAGDAASAAVSFLSSSLGARRFAQIDERRVVHHYPCRFQISGMRERGPLSEKFVGNQRRIGHDYAQVEFLLNAVSGQPNSSVVAFVPMDKQNLLDAMLRQALTDVFYDRHEGFRLERETTRP